MRPFDKGKQRGVQKEFKLRPHTVKTQHFSENENKDLSDTKKNAINKSAAAAGRTVPNK